MECYEQTSLVQASSVQTAREQDGTKVGKHYLQ